MAFNTSGNSEQKLLEYWQNQGGDAGDNNMFGHKDYLNILKKQVQDQGWLGSVYNARETVYSFLNRNPQIVDENNREGKPDGLMEAVKTGADNPISTRTIGDNDGHEQFGYYDFIHARSHGKSDQDIIQWLDNHQEVKDNVADNIYNHVRQIYDSNWTEDGPKDGPPPTPPGGNTGGNQPGTYTGDIDVVPGMGGDKFGHHDYYDYLKRDYEQHGSTDRLIEIRNEVLNFLSTAGDDKVHEDNRPDREGGLHKTISDSIKLDHDREKRRFWDGGRKHDREGNWNREQLKLTPKWSSETGQHTHEEFTYADYLGSLAGGHDKYDIYRYLRANTNTWEGKTQGEEIYNQVRDDLIRRGAMFSNMSGNTDQVEFESGDFGELEAQPQLGSTAYYSWRHALENPLWHEYGEYLQRENVIDDDVTFVDKQDFEEIFRNLQQNYDRGDDEKGAGAFNSQEDLEWLVGKGNIPGGTTVSYGFTHPPHDWESGTYWSYWGQEGPPDRDQGDGLNARDLTHVQKWYTLDNLQAQDPSTAKKRMEKLENKFFAWMYGPEKKWQEAEDHWGLDIKRENFDWSKDLGLIFDEQDNIRTDDRAKELLERMFSGKVDYAWYNDNNSYKWAAENLGFDEDKKAADTDYVPTIDTVQELRLANVFVFGKENPPPGKHGWDILDEWEMYEAKFDSSTAEPYKPETIDFQYTPIPKEEIDTPRDMPAAPTINIPPTQTTRPIGLPDDWTIQD